MTRTPANLSQQIDVLLKESSALAEDLSQAALLLRDEGKPIDAVLLGTIDVLHQEIHGVCDQVYQRAAGLEMPNTPSKPASLAVARSLLEQILAFEGGIEHARATALAILDLVLSLRHIEQLRFDPLMGCQSQAASLRDDILAIAPPELHPAAHELARGQHVFNAVTALAAEAATLGDDTSDALFNQIQTEFSRQLALALARGRISVGEVIQVASVVSSDEIRQQPPSNSTEEPTVNAEADQDNTINKNAAPGIDKATLQPTTPEKQEKANSTASADVAAPHSDEDEEPEILPVAEVALNVVTELVGLTTSQTLRAASPVYATKTEASPIKTISFSEAKPSTALLTSIRHAANTAWISELLIDSENQSLVLSNHTAVPDDLAERVYSQMCAWLKDWAYIPHAYLLGSWLATVDMALVSAFPPLELFEIAMCAFHPQIDMEHCPSFSSLYTTLSVTPSTVQQVSAWFLAAGLVIVRGEQSARELVEFIEWMNEPMWQPWLRFGQILLTYIHDDGISLVEISRILDKASETIDAEVERTQARDILNAITAPAYFDFKKGQRLSLIMNRELAWLRQDLQRSRPKSETLEWFEKLRLERQLDRWANEAEPRTVPLAGKRRQGILRDLQALRTHIQRWGMASANHNDISTRQTALHVFKGFAYIMRQEQENWRHTWSQTDYPALSAWCELLLQRINPVLKRVSGDNTLEVAP